MKRKIRLTENDLHRIVNRSVKKVLKEGLLDQTSASPDYVGQQLGELICNYLVGQNQTAAACVQEILKFQSGQQLQSFSNALYTSLRNQYQRMNNGNY